MQIRNLAGVALAALSVLTVSHQAQASVVIQTNLTSIPSGGAGLVPIDLSSFAAPISTGDYTVGTGASQYNIQINDAPGPENYFSPSQHIIGTNPVNEGVVISDNPSTNATPVTGPGPTFFSGNYLSTGFGNIVITFATPKSALALLWGSVDSTNELDLLSGGSYSGSSVTLGSVVSGGSILGSSVTSTADGSQGFGGSYYVLLTSTDTFNQIYLTSNL
ncbi:MAG TPA: hypothetical protein VGZ73_23555, partial [Bryobacteraceae bacterium]|nr:hypothetical protein [Bryobacteraceae bacterium]